MKKRYWIPLLILLILIGIRIALPFWVENYINKKLDGIEGYTGSVKDVDMHLYRGAYSVDSLVIDKMDDNNEVPFVTVRQIDASIEWASLFDGALVGEIYLITPRINFVAPNKDEGQFGTEVDWTKHLREMMPIRINRFAVRNGSVHYLDVASSPQVDLPLENLDLDILNISNIKGSEDLPTDVTLNAVSIGGGTMNVEAKANLLKQIPDVDLNFEFEEVNLPDLNNFLEAYANVDAEQGEFNLYSEMVINNGYLEGYVKPIIRNLKVLNLEESEGNILEVVWEGIVGVVTEVFENQPKDQFASQVPLEGDLNDPETEVFPAIWNIFRNAFVEAFSKQTEGELRFEGSGEEENN